MKKVCSICNGKGLVPSKVLGKFSGKPIPNAWQDCLCREEEHEHYRRPRPSDWDFPMSDTFRGFSYEYCGLPDPGYIPPEPLKQEPQEQVIIHRHSNMGKQEYDLLQQTAREVKYLRGKVEGKPRPAKPRGYKGIK